MSRAYPSRTTRTERAKRVRFARPQFPIRSFVGRLVPGRKLAVLAAPLLSFAFIAAWVPGAQAATTAHAFYENNRHVCMVANHDSIYDQGNCPTPASVNHAGLWYLIPEGSDPVTGKEMYVIKNVHYGNCLTIGDSGGPYGATCPTRSGLNGVNHAQLWIFIPADDASGAGDNINNIHTRHSLFWSSSSSAITQTGSSSNQIWGVGSTSV
jgi:hypothetical protein